MKKILLQIKGKSFNGFFKIWCNISATFDNHFYSLFLTTVWRIESSSTPFLDFDDGSILRPLLAADVYFFYRLSLQLRKQKNTTNS